MTLSLSNILCVLVATSFDIISTLGEENSRGGAHRWKYTGGAGAENREALMTHGVPGVKSTMEGKIIK